MDEQAIKNIWQRALELLKPPVVQDMTYKVYISKIKPLGIIGNIFILSVSSNLELELIMRYRPVIEDAVTAILGPNYTVNFISAENSNPQSETVVNPAPVYTSFEEEKPKDDFKSFYINPRYTFDNFVAYPSNELAYANAILVAENPGVLKNPLFIYGDSGLGKTHLIHAIANYAKSINKDANIILTSSERFTTELINSMKTKTEEEFRIKYRNADFLMIDDVQFFTGKDRTQEEFFHTFNELYNQNKQIVLTSDKPPDELDGVEKRLVTRFWGGMVADIKKPDYESRLAILQKKAESQNVNIPYDVYCYIADNIKSSVRILEGALTRVVSFANISGKPITKALAEEALFDYLETGGEIRITATKISDVVSKYFEIPIAEIKGRRKTAEVALARQVAMYFCKIFTDMSLKLIGNEYGGRDHSTVISAVEKIEKMIESDPSFEASIKIMEKEIKNFYED